MGFSRKPSITFTEEEMAEMKRPLTKEEEAKLLKEFNEMISYDAPTTAELVKLKHNIDSF